MFCQGRVRLQLPGEVGITLHYKKHGCLCPWIAELDPAGLMARWNIEKPQERVGIHDRILEVNGMRGPPWVLIKEVLAPCTLKAEVQALSPQRLSDPGLLERKADTRSPTQCRLSDSQEALALGTVADLIMVIRELTQQNFVAMLRSKQDRVTEVNGEGGESEELMERLLSLDLTLFTITAKDRRHSFPLGARLVKLHLPGDTGMSVDCEKSKSAVPWISRISNGLLKSWNEDMPEQSVAVHDRIVSVNGCAGSSELILDRLALAEKTIELLALGPRNEYSVLAGRICRGAEGLVEPPADTQGSRYDSTVDDPINPKVFCVFRDFQAIPLYLAEISAA
eukprot:s2176_g3.t1